MLTASAISKVYELTSGKEGESLIYEKDLDLAKDKIKALFDSCGYSDVLAPLDYYLKLINETHSVMYQYMSSAQKAQHRHDLKAAYLLLLAQEQYERDSQKLENSQSYIDKRRQCEELLDKLDQSEQQEAPFGDLKRAKYSPTDYMFIFVGHELSKKMVNHTSNTKSATKALVGGMNAINAKRLYWVWGSSFINTVLSQLPSDFFNVDDAKHLMGMPSPYTGTLSWALYYLRFSVHLSLLLKNSIKGPWLTEEEKESAWWKLPANQRFQTQWQQRKFALLNDSLWATANLASFFWLTGSMILEHWGSLLTIVLLIFDLTISLWDFAEQSTLKDKELNSFNEEIQKLADLDKRTAEQEHQLNALRQAKKQCIKNWDYKKYELYNNIGYAVGLMLAFALMSLPFLPIALPATLILSIAGTVLCFAFTVMYTAIQGGLELNKEVETGNDLKKAHDEKIELFALWSKDPQVTENQKKLLYLEIQSLKAQSEHQRQVVINKSLHFVRSLMMSVFTPAIIMASLVFLPLGIGLGVLGAYVGLAIASSLLIDALCKVDDMNPLSEIDEQDYLEFCKNPELCKFAPKKQASAFFQNKESTSDNLEDPLMEDNLSSAPL